MDQQAKERLGDLTLELERLENRFDLVNPLSAERQELIQEMQKIKVQISELEQDE